MCAMMLCAKRCLVTLYTIQIIGILFLFILMIIFQPDINTFQQLFDKIGLKIGRNQCIEKFDNIDDDNNGLTMPNFRSITNEPVSVWDVVILVIWSLTIAMVFALLGIYGVIKENRLINIVYTVLSVTWAVILIVSRQSVATVILQVVFVVLQVYFTQAIHQSDQEQSHFGDFVVDEDKTDGDDKTDQ